MDRGADVEVIALGGWLSTVNDVVKKYNILERTTYVPSTTRDVADAFGQLIRVCFSHPLQAFDRVRRAGLGQHLLLSRPAVAARALLLPSRHPEACLIHDLGLAKKFTFLRNIYPNARICLSYNGGEVVGCRKPDDYVDVFSNIDRVICLSEYARKEVIAKGCPQELTCVLPLGFDTSRFKPREPRRYLPTGSLRLVSVGRLSPEKGLVTVLEALKILSDEGLRSLDFRIVGTGLEEPSLRRSAKALGVDSLVTFLGEIPGHGVPNVLENSDVLVLPSLQTKTWAETQAAVVQEALLMKCVTVTTPTGALPETNAPVMHRFFFAPGDATALAGVLRSVAAMSPLEFQELGEAGRHFALERYDSVGVGDRLYDKLIN